MTKLKSILLILFSALLCLYCTPEDIEIKLKFKEPAYDLFVGDTLNFASQVTVENTKQLPSFTTSDAKVATITESGLLTAVGAGDVTVTAKLMDKTDTTLVHVNFVEASSIVVECPDSLVVGDEWKTVLAKVEPSNFDYANLEWNFTPSSESLGFESQKISNSEYEIKVADYHDGANVIVTVGDKNTDLFKADTIYVVEPAAPEVAAKIIRLDAPDTLTESEETWGTVTAEVVPEGSEEYNYENLVWKFVPSDSLETGFEYEKVTGAQYKLRFKAYKQDANVGIEVTDKVGGKFAVKTIKVEKKPLVGAASITVSPDSLKLFVDESAVLKAYTTPENYDQSLLVWESQNEEVVTVVGSKVTAVGEGSTIVKVFDSVSKLEATCAVTVKVPVKEAVVKTIVLDTTNLNLRVGEKDYQLKATCYDEEGVEVKDYAGLIWSTTKVMGIDGLAYDPVEVSQQGVVTPKAAGNTQVKVAVESNQTVYATCNVSVQAKEIKVERLWLHPAEQVIDIDETYTLKVTSDPEFSTVENKTIIYASSDPKIASVASDGEVRGVSYGEAEITATAASGVVAKAKVLVKSSKVDVEQVVLDVDEKLAMKIGETKNITATLKPSNSTIRKATWTTSDSDIVELTVDESSEKVTITALAEGESVITAEADGKKAQVTVTVSKIKVESVKLNVSAYTLDINKSFQLTATVTPENATDKTVTWTSSDETVATVSADGLVKSLDKEGKAIITATADGKSATCEITVEIPVIEVTDLVLTASKTQAQVGENVTITCKLLPEGATGVVNWVSSDASIASVVDGVVTVNKYVPNAEGNCVVTITAMTVSGEVSKSIEIKVTPVPLTELTLNDGKSLTLDKGKSSSTLTYIYNKDAYPKTITWSTSNPSVATVTDGVVTAVAMGSAKISLTITDPLGNTVTASCDVVVNGIEPDAVILQPDRLDLIVNEVYRDFNVTVGPEDADWKDVKFVSSDPEILQVINEKTGELKAVAVGDAVITVTSTRNTNLSATCAVHVKEVDFEIELNAESTKVPQFEKIRITPSYTNGYMPTVSKWESSDPSIATVTDKGEYAEVYVAYDGILGDDEEMKVIITHKAGTRSASVELEITHALPKDIEILGLPENNTLYLGETFGPEFRAVVKPIQAKQYVTWWGDTQIAGVANGSWVARHAGYWQLNVTASEGSAQVTRTVFITLKPNVVQGGTLSNTNLSLMEGEAATLAIDFVPAHNEYYDYNVTWVSSDESVATVENGKVTAVSQGAATVSATLSNGDVLTCDVTVTEPVVSGISVGDYYYSDGSTSTELDATKTVVGVVFAVLNPTQMGDGKLAADHPEATHGLVVSLKQTKTKWQQSTASNVSGWLSENMGYDYLTDESRMCGYSNTVGLKAYNAQCETANRVRVVLPTDATVDSNSSGWYVPSYAELKLLYEANGGYVRDDNGGSIYAGDISAKIVAAGGTAFSCDRKSYGTADGMLDAPSYWSSTESAASYEWAASLHMGYGGSTNKPKTAKTYYLARYILAF